MNRPRDFLFHGPAVSSRSTNQHPQLISERDDLEGRRSSCATTLPKLENSTVRGDYDNITTLLVVVRGLRAGAQGRMTPRLTIRNSSKLNKTRIIDLPAGYCP